MFLSQAPPAASADRSQLVKNRHSLIGGVQSLSAFHEKAGRSQVKSAFFFWDKGFLLPSGHCRHASIRTLEERSLRSVQVGRSRFSRCCHLLGGLGAIQILALIVAFVSCTVQTKVFTNPNSSMEPTLVQGEKFTVEMQPFQASRGNLVIFQHEGILILKRVIGITGDVVEGRDSQVFVNGAVQHESYIQHVGKATGPLGKFGPVKVPAGQLFVMGDNRDYSFDSRDSRFGLASVLNVKGRPVKVVTSSNPQRVDATLR
jgi:signal peptidase I